MATLSILQYPDERLRTIAEPVEVFDDKLQQTIDDMIQTMQEANGIGLAATQVNLHKRIVVIQIDEPLVLVNPEIVSFDGEFEFEEGCLSVPGFYEVVTRSERITVRAQDRHGNHFDMDADGLLSACIQHEIDHLNGKVFVDHLSQMKRQLITRKLQPLSA